MVVAVAAVRAVHCELVSDDGMRSNHFAVDSRWFIERTYPTGLRVIRNTVERTFGAAWIWPTGNFHRVHGIGLHWLVQRYIRER